MQSLIFRITGILLASLFLSSQPLFACTDFRLTAKDGTVLIARSMEFATDMKSNVRSSTRGRSFSSTSANGKPQLAWKAKYGYLFIDGLGADATTDGMNEQGLSFEFLYLPGETQYQTPAAGQDSQALPYYTFGDWVLSNFKTIDEVKQALSKISVVSQPLQGYGNVVFPLHASIFDTSGKGIVIEFINGKVNVYDNDLGILTNIPQYPWQITNLRNYVYLSPYAPQPIKANGMTFAATGQGAGSIGLPGDTSPPSRFVKIAFLRNNAIQAENATDAINLAEHLLNNVDIALGTVRAKQDGTASDSMELTQWVVFKDLTHKVLSYRTYDNMTVRSISLDKIDFSENAPRLKMPLSNGPYSMDITQKFLSQKAS